MPKRKKTNNEPSIFLQKRGIVNTLKTPKRGKYHITNLKFSYPKKVVNTNTVTIRIIRNKNHLNKPGFG